MKWTRVLTTVGVAVALISGLTGFLSMRTRHLKLLAVPALAAGVLLGGGFPAAAQVGALDSGKPLPTPAQKAPPFQRVRIVHGIVGPTGSFEKYSAAFIPAGTGGTALSGTVTLTQISDDLIGSGTLFTTQLVPGQFIMVPDNSNPTGFGFYRIFSITNNTLAKFTLFYAGSTISGATAVKDMTLFNAWRIDFTRPFQNAPTIVITARGAEPTAGQEPAFNVMQIKTSTGPIPNDHFEVFQFQSPFGPYLPGGTATFDFLAIGQ
jgi:hypothetical protein